MYRSIYNLNTINYKFGLTCHNFRLFVHKKEQPTNHRLQMTLYKSSMDASIFTDLSIGASCYNA